MLSALPPGAMRFARRPRTFSRLGLIRQTSPAASMPTCRQYTPLTAFWLASGGLTPTENEDTHAKLVRAGYLRQSHAGIFHMLPLGLRVQQKLEALIDKHMSQLAASKVSLSSISSQALWEQTNRLEGYGQELFRFEDRKQIPYLLAPTHEEEITTLVSKAVKSYKDLPLRLYQISRKYRDEMRPRQGVLRSREFVMKDLYTFDSSIPSALSTYDHVRAAYSRLFDELKIPYLVAEASSGDIGGDLSHEYHLPTAIGEDNVISCNSCHYVANEELAECRQASPVSLHRPTPASEGLSSATVWRGVSKDRSTLINVWLPHTVSTVSEGCHQVSPRTLVNLHAIKAIFPSLDSSADDPVSLWKGDSANTPSRIVNIVDERLGDHFIDSLKTGTGAPPLNPAQDHASDSTVDLEFITPASLTGGRLNTLRIQSGDGCPRCPSGVLAIQKAVELGHTFHLGTRYSVPLGANVSVPASLLQADTADTGATVVPMQMGCHGIGVSRIIGAVADHLADDAGLNWPRAMAPFEVAVLPREGLKEDAMEVARGLTNYRPETGPCIDVALDDRDKKLSWKMKDADLAGYPVSVILGKKWGSDRQCEVQCRRLGIRSDVPVDGLPVYISDLLSRL